MSSTITLTTRPANRTSRPSLRRLARVGATAAGVAVAVNLVIFAAGRAAGVVFSVAEPGTEHAHILAFDVVFLTVASFVVGMFAAAGAVWLRRPSLRALQGVGAVLAVVSCWGDVFIPATAPAKVLLASMHIVVGIAYVAALGVVRTVTR